jgi:DNA-binding CsgD family transcriptional regulator
MLAMRNYPKSWLSGLIHTNDEVIGTAPRLTPAQRQVFEAVCEGASTIDIAKRLGRSPHNIRNHISDIFEIFGVRSRAELLALLRKR